MLPGMQRYLIAGNFSNASKKGKFYLVYNLLGNECGAGDGRLNISMGATEDFLEKAEEVIQKYL
jgi:hypothetical protein